MQQMCSEMAIIEQLLAEFDTPDGTTYRIEYNENGYIHLHTEHVRVDLTPEEFLELTETVTMARTRLMERKDELETQ